MKTIVRLYWFFIICFLLNNVTVASLEELKNTYTWPIKKPEIATDFSSMFGNEKQLKAILNQHMTLIVELGSWLGASTRFILNHAPQATVIAVDHWLGSIPHQERPHQVAKLKTLYDTFLINCWQYKDRLIPLRNTTLKGLQEIYKAGLVPDLIYVDAAHDFDSVTADLELSLSLFPSVQLVGDDWNWSYKEDKFPVRRAVIDFARRHNFSIIATDNFWQLIRY